MRVFAIERRRTGALLVALVLTVVGIVLTIAHVPPFSPYGTWSSSWAAGASWIDDTNIVLGPLAAVAAAWVGGRERRREMTELLASTPRSTLRRTVLTWVAFASGVLLGVVGFAIFVAAAIAPSVSYGGGRWPVSWALVFAGVIVCTSLGFASGRLVPGRLVPPVVGVLIYLVVGISGYLPGGWTRLMPVASLPISEATQLVPVVALGYAVWLLTLVVGLLLLAAGRSSRVPAAAVLLVGVLVAIPLGGAPYGPMSRQDSWVERDPAATRLVCTRSAPVVCTTRVHAGLLPSLTPVARDLLASASQVLPVDRVVELDPLARTQQVEDGALPLQNLDGRSLLLRSGLSEPERIAPETSRDLTTSAECRQTYHDALGETELLLDDVAASLVLGRPVPDSVSPGPLGRLRDYLTAEPGRARTWLSNYLLAASHCDVAAVRALSEPGLR